MFWRRKKAPPAPPQVGCFGKLPATGDFVRLAAGGEELASFDRWLSPALDGARRQLGASFDAAYGPSSGLFVHCGEGKGDAPPARAIVGAWAASGDSAGRAYPIVVFASYDYERLVALGPALLPALRPLLGGAHQLATGGRSLDVGAFLAQVSHLVPPALDDVDVVRARFAAWTAEQTMHALWDDAFRSEAPRFWALQTLADAVEPFRSQEHAKTGLGLRVPLGPWDDHAAAVWVDMTLHLLRWEHTLLNLFWRPQGSLLIHLGAPHIGSFRELLTPTREAEHIADLCNPPREEVGRTGARRHPALEALVARTDLPIAAFLRGLG